VAAIIAPTTVPGYKLSECHPLAHDKVRFVGEAVAMCVASTRAEAEDLTEEIEVEFDELPVLVNALAARVTENIRVHEQWSDNSFLTLSLDNRFEANAKGAPVVVKRGATRQSRSRGGDALRQCHTQALRQRRLPQGADYGA
jgi:carbon-monoxide dehydrogenase large subunit